MLFLHRGDLYGIGGLEKKCEAAQAIGCQAVVVPSSNKLDGNKCNGMPLIAIDDVKHLLHYAFKGGSEEGESHHKW